MDYIFNNAGIGIGGPVHLHSIEDWRNIVGVNLIGVINGVQAAYQIMVQQGFGHIVNTASMAACSQLPAWSLTEPPSTPSLVFPWDFAKPPSLAFESAFYVPV
jgi:NAD(P)-dependent dehydrogenase (short-subunit alcohol dehydrogenase family)